MDKIVGYLIWRRDPTGRPVAFKQSADIRSAAQPVTIKEREDQEIEIIPLTGDDWVLTLDTLIANHPPKKPFYNSVGLPIREDDDEK